MRRLPDYEIINTNHAYYVVRHRNDGVGEIIERFESEFEAERFCSFLAWIRQAPRRQAAH